MFKVNRPLYPRYKVVCLALGLLEDDNQWKFMLAEAALKNNSSTISYSVHNMFPGSTRDINRVEQYFVNIKQELSYRKPLPILRQRSKSSGLVDNVIAVSPLVQLVRLTSFIIGEHRRSRRRSVEIHTQLGPGLTSVVDHQTQVDAATIRSELELDEITTTDKETQTYGVWWAPVLERIYPLVGGRVLSARDTTPKFQYAGRDSETEVRLRPLDLEGQISVEIVSRGVGTHRCRRTQYRASDIDWSVIRDEIRRGGVEYDAFMTPDGWIQGYRWLSHSEHDSEDDTD
ncbi:hypothetical protein J6590_077355 [Homalodisca vitripennis]|nr:hypothetical protein J6590_077355 [Homalodisca vitripennis]